MDNVTVSTAGQQDVITPMSLIESVQKIWPCWFDLAATEENKRFSWYFSPEADALKKTWADCGSRGGRLWLNPPFSSAKKCEPNCEKSRCLKRGWHQEYDVKGLPVWMEKCAKESQAGARIVTLTLSSRGTEWYHKFVKPYALSLVLLDRITFEGHKDPYPKELMINVFGEGITGEGYWDWKGGRALA